MRNLSWQACPDIAKKIALPSGTRSFSEEIFLQSEQLQDQLSVRIRDAESLYAQLLLDLQGGEPGGCFIHIRIDERTDARGQ